MKTCVLKTTIRTFFEDGSFRNNVVALRITEEAATTLIASWRVGDGAQPLHQSATALYLAKNQNADLVLEIDGEAVAGIRGMSAEEGCGDVFTYEGMEDNL